MAQFVYADLFPSGMSDGPCKNCGALVLGENPDQSNHLVWHNMIATMKSDVDALKNPTP
jgi:hypothetical protein